MSNELIVCCTCRERENVSVCVSVCECVCECVCVWGRITAWISLVDWCCWFCVAGRFKSVSSQFKDARVRFYKLQLLFLYSFSFFFFFLTPATLQSERDWQRLTVRERERLWETNKERERKTERQSERDWLRGTNAKTDWETEYFYCCCCCYFFSIVLLLLLLDKNSVLLKNKE